VAKGILPSDPPRADHRLIRYMLDAFYKKKGVAPDPDEFDKVTNVFSVMGGS